MADAPDWLSVIGSLKRPFLIPIMETFVMKASFQITNVLHPMKPQPGWILKLTDPVQLCCCGTVFWGSSLLATVLVSDNGVSPPPTLSLAGLRKQPPAHCSCADTLHCRWFPLSSHCKQGAVWVRWRGKKEWVGGKGKEGEVEKMS